MSKLIFILDQNNENISFDVSKNITMIQLKLKGEGLETSQNVYLNFSNNDFNFGQTFLISDDLSWRTVVLPRSISGKIMISRPFYNKPPETAEGVSVIIEEIRYR